MNVVKLDNNRIILIHDDCLHAMRAIKPNSIDMVFADLPYGTTACKWDTLINLNEMWRLFKIIGKVTTPYIFTAAFPFTAVLGMSNITQLKYDFAWDKVNKYTDSLNSNYKPMRRHENILVFYNKSPTYNKQYRIGNAYNKTHNNGHGEFTEYGNGDEFRRTINDGQHHNPCTVLEIKADNKLENGLHPTQKPLELLEYLIKTYTNPGDTVLDPTFGSCTTGIACIKLNRKFIGIEQNSAYFNIGVSRMNATLRIRDETTAPIPEHSN